MGITAQRAGIEKAATLILRTGGVTLEQIERQVARVDSETGSQRAIQQAKLDAMRATREAALRKSTR